MTTEKLRRDTYGLPFVFRFAQPLPSVPRRILRYDKTRQISQVLMDGYWIDSPDATEGSTAFSRETRIANETTDDE